MLFLSLHVVWTGNSHFGSHISIPSIFYLRLQQSGKLCSPIFICSITGRIAKYHLQHLCWTKYAMPTDRHTATCGCKAGFEMFQDLWFLLFFYLFLLLLPTVPSGGNRGGREELGIWVKYDQQIPQLRLKCVCIRAL